MRRLLLLVALVAIGVPGALAASAARPASHPRPARFLVGTAVTDINPTTAHPQYLGGFSNMTKPTSKVHDPLQVRAFVVARGGHLVAFAIADVQGWFAANQEGPYGVSDARRDAAAALAARFPGTTSADIVVSSTHSHAAATVMGIWGPTDVWYLKRLHDQTVRAIVSAASRLRPAELWTASADTGAVDGSNVSETDVYDGWTVDGDTPVLWARDPDTHATVGAYVNVPIHADIVIGSRLNAASADHIGAERAELDRLLGGTAVVAMGTLGRQESLIQADGPEEADRVGHYVVDRVLGALGRARPLTDATLATAEQYVVAPGTNPALLALNTVNAAKYTCTPVACSIDRSLLPPYLVGDALGTWVTSVRIGPLLYVSEPGEAFPEVSQALRDSVPGAVVRPIGMAQDQLGYYWPVEDAPFTSVINNSDHLTFNASGELADITVAASTANALRLGFQVTPTQPRAGAVDPLAHVRSPGVQFYVAQTSGAARTVYFETATNRANDDAPLVGVDHKKAVHWTFGDGTSAVVEKSATHTFAKPGRYVVTARVTDTKGRSRSWSQTVVITHPIYVQLWRSGETVCAAPSYGNGGPPLDYRFSDGHRTVHQTSGRWSAPRSRRVTVTVVDAAGSVATTSKAIWWKPTPPGLYGADEHGC